MSLKVRRALVKSGLIKRRKIAIGLVASVPLSVERELTSAQLAELYRSLYRNSKATLALPKPVSPRATSASREAQRQLPLFCPRQA
jgi:hypothetical protein